MRNIMWHPSSGHRTDNRTPTPGSELQATTRMSSSADTRYRFSTHVPGASVGFST
jgi:hypothetical protein